MRWVFDLWILFWIFKSFFTKIFGGFLNWIWRSITRGVVLSLFIKLSMKTILKKKTNQNLGDSLNGRQRQTVCTMTYTKTQAKAYLMGARRQKIVILVSHWPNTCGAIWMSSRRIDIEMGRKRGKYLIIPLINPICYSTNEKPVLISPLLTSHSHGIIKGALCNDFVQVIVSANYKNKQFDLYEELECKQWQRDGNG